MKKFVAIAAGAVAAFAAAFFPLKNFCRDRLEEFVVLNKTERSEKYIKVFGFKDKAGNAFVEICQMADTGKNGDTDLERGGLLEMKKYAHKELIYQGSMGTSLDKNFFMLRKTYRINGKKPGRLILQPADFAFTPLKDGDTQMRYSLEIPERDLPIIIEWPQ